MVQLVTLSGDRRVCELIFHILQVACAGGMSNERGEELYNEILTHYLAFSIEATDAFLEDLLKIATSEQED